MNDNMMFNGNPSYGNSIKWAPIVNASANTNGIDANVLGAIIEQESSWNLKSHNPATVNGVRHEVNGLGSLLDINQPSNYKNGDQTIQIPAVAKFIKGCYTQGSRSGGTSDIEMCYHYYGAKSPNDGGYYNRFAKKKAIYEKYDIPILKSSSDKTPVNTTASKSTVTIPRVSIKSAFTNIKTSAVNIPNKVMGLLGVSAIGLLAIIVLISQATIPNDETL
jgi:hypothetical protein